ncbi:HD domain-containing protein [Desulfosporosinus sp. SRJS8]|nr:HD domain-containing protein [Desulfosporosinus sp. SRJS8]
MNVALFATITGMGLRYKEMRLKYLTLGALLHDLGKLRVPKEILSKKGSLTEEEFVIYEATLSVGSRNAEEYPFIT